MWTKVSSGKPETVDGGTVQLLCQITAQTETEDIKLLFWPKSPDDAPIFPVCLTKTVKCHTSMSWPTGIAAEHFDPSEALLNNHEVPSFDFTTSLSKFQFGSIQMQRRDIRAEPLS
jgi:hypothetical protein